ncbi:succinate dehydrogenase, hydrophobic membrane anchor protein [Pyruvatibacter mobilis]|uniref:succinate dehydrogenase, hydrophobic membrane anchor protein n=1 Tax=Pyruvatibacter mobilis TaxID=1712261 RepID=UPI003D11FE0D
MTSSNTDLRTPRAKVRGLGSAKDGTGHFIAQRVTAVAMVPLGLALIAAIISQLGAEHDSFKAFIGNPLVAVGFLLLIFTGTYHMRLGMQVIIEDYVHGEGLKMLSLLANTFFAIVIAAVAGFSVLKLALGA